MKARDFDPLKLDVEAFAKAEALLEGAWRLAELVRLASSVVAGPSDGGVAWSARGEHRTVRGGPPQVWLHLQASADVMLECQRCLAPVAAKVQAQRSFLFVHGENTAAELDAESEDDVLAVTRALDLRELIEDELLLEIPLVPRHDVCPQPLSIPVDDPVASEDEKPNPFAVLSSLKKGGLSN